LLAIPIPILIPIPNPDLDLDLDDPRHQGSGSTTLFAPRKKERTRRVGIAHHMHPSGGHATKLQKNPNPIGGRCPPYAVQGRRFVGDFDFDPESGSGFGFG